VGLAHIARRALALAVLLALVALTFPSLPSSALTAPVAASSGGVKHDAATPPSGCSSQPPEPGEHCLPIAAVVTGTAVTSDGRCAAIVVLQVQLNAKVDQYDATWVPAGQTAATTYTSDQGSWTTSSVAYGGLTYTVPKGDAVWFLGQGSGPAPCASAGPGTVQAWGWTTHSVVRGHVKYKGTGGPAPGVKVTATCASGGTTTTDSYGAYGFILNPGSCTISPSVPKGEAAIPTQRVVSVANADITDVDFVVPGGALKVYIKQLEALRSGLAVHSVHYSQYPADFVATTTGQGANNHYVCQSGCVDITVSVIDPATGKAPAPHATVDASIDFLTAGVQSFDGQSISKALGASVICSTSVQGQGKDCGSSLHGLETDADGQVHLRYWAPGVLADSTTTLRVTASCDSSPCQASQTMAELPLTVKPYEIYEHTSTLSSSDVAELNEWAEGSTIFTQYLKTASNSFNALKYSLQVLKKFEQAEKLAEEGLDAVEHAEPVAIVVDAGLTVNEAFESNAMMAMFLDDSGLSAFGIGRPTTETSASGTPSYAFQNQLINQVAVPDFLKIGTGGFWWASAEYIHEILNAYGTGQVPGWTLSTAVYEVSHCSDPSNDACEPGYRSDVGFSVPGRSGIQPELVMELTLSHNGAAPAEEVAFDIPYDALAWTTTQPDLTGVIHDN
jgi:hypothetical protein